MDPTSKVATSPSDPVKLLDALVAKGWAEAGIRPSSKAPDHEFVRRAYLDLLGRIPSIVEATSFLASKDAAKREQLVDQLLDHPDYPKNFATVWTVMLIGRRPQGRDVNRPELAAWLRRQLLENRPWDEVSRDLLTAQGSNKENGAVNYALAHREDGAVNLTSFTTRVFLGQQIQCTQCHDHPENDWKQADFWGINAFFKGMRTRQLTRVDATGAEVRDATELYDEPTAAYSTFESRNAMIGIAFPTYLDGRKISQGTDADRRVELARFITGDEEQFGRAFVNRMWGHLLGRGIVHPVDDFGDHNPPSNPELLDELTKGFRESGYDIKALIRRIMGTQAYQLSSMATPENEKDETLFSHQRAKPMTPEQLFDSLLVATAAHKAGGEAKTDRLREAWLRQFVHAFTNDEETEGEVFQGTIPLALMLMNGDLMARATSGRSGGVLTQAIERAVSQRGRTEAQVVNMAYLAALARYPSAQEMSRAARLFNSSPDHVAVIEDLFWALLNSSEFFLNH